MNVGTYETTENRPTPMTVDSTTQTRIVRSAKWRSGTSGSLTRSSIAMNAAIPTIAMSAAIITADAGRAASGARPAGRQDERGDGDPEHDRSGEVESAAGASRDVRNRDDREREGDESDGDVDPEHPAPAPGVGDEHRRRAGRRGSRSGNAAPMIDRIRGRSRGVVTSPMIVCGIRWSPAEPMPCPIRASVSCVMSWANPHSSEATGRRRGSPGRSAARPRGRRACRAPAAAPCWRACTRRCTQLICWTAPSSPAIVASDVATTV